MTQSMPAVTTPGGTVHEPHDWVSMDVGQLGKSLYNAEDSPLSDQIRSLKIKTITDSVNNGRLEEVVQFSRSTDGLISNELRRKVWPVLLEVEPSGLFGDDSLVNDLAINDSPLHKDEDQVKLDIKRSFTILTHATSVALSFSTVYSADEIATLKKNLFALVVKILRKYPCLHYYQGYHDIASVVLLVCYHQNTGKFDEQLAFKVLESLTLNHLRDFMITDVNLSLTHLKLIPALLEVVDHGFFRLIKQINNSYVCSNSTYYDYNFLPAISSIITLFSHDVDNLHQLLVLWDFSFSYRTIVINVYIYVAALLNRKDDIYAQLGIKESSEDLDIDKDTLHNLVSPSYLFKDLSDSELIKILNSAEHFYDTFPLDKLSNSYYTYDSWFNEHNQNSVLMTTSTTFPSLDYKLPNNAPKVAEIVHLQDQEMAQLTTLTMDNERKAFEAQDELSSASEYDQTALNSLSSSLSSVQSSTSSLNTRILKSSSIYFKKLLFSESTKDGEEKSPVKRNNVFKLTTLYKLSLTVGFIGFLLHFLLSKNNLNSYSLYFNRVVKESLHNLSESQFIHNSFQAGQVGLGNIRNSIFGLLG